jgi:hypothetical protein
VNLGFAALYAAFAAVALWLLGEVLLQHRAPLPWRVLALAGFAGVAGGVVLGSVPLIGGGAAGFAVGQALVTRAVKRADGRHWSLRRSDGSVPGPLGRLPFLAPAGAPPASDEPAEPVGEVGPVEEAPPPLAAVPVDEAPTQTWHAGYAYLDQPVHQPQPLEAVDEAGDSYGVYTGVAAQQGYGYQDYGQQYGYDASYPQYAGYQEQYAYQQQTAYQGEYAAYGWPQETYQQQGYAAEYGGETYQDPYQQQSYPPQQYS